MLGSVRATPCLIATAPPLSVARRRDRGRRRGQLRVAGVVEQGAGQPAQGIGKLLLLFGRPAGEHLLKPVSPLCAAGMV